MLATASRREVAPPLIPLPPTTLFFVEATCCRLVTSKAVSSCLQAALVERSDGSERSEAKVKGGDIALLTQSVAGFKFVFSWCGSRWVKFVNLASNLNVKS